MINTFILLKDLKDRSPFSILELSDDLKNVHLESIFLSALVDYTLATYTYWIE